MQLHMFLMSLTISIFGFCRAKRKYFNVEALCCWTIWRFIVKMPNIFIPAYILKSGQQKIHLIVLVIVTRNSLLHKIHADHLPNSFSNYALNLKIRRFESRLLVKYILLVYGKSSHFSIRGCVHSTYARFLPFLTPLPSVQ